MNKQILTTLYQYLKAIKVNKDATNFWMEDEVKSYKRYDLNDDIISYMEVNKCIVLGISQQKSNIYKVKLQYQNIGTDNVNTVYYIVNYILYKDGDDYKLGNSLLYNINYQQYRKVDSRKITYYFPKDFEYSKNKIDSANRYLLKIESFFNKNIDSRINYVEYAQISVSN